MPAARLCRAPGRFRPRRPATPPAPTPLQDLVFENRHLLVDVDLLRRRQHRQADPRIRPRRFLGARLDALPELAVEALVTSTISSFWLFPAREHAPAASTAAPSATAIHR